MHTLIKCGNGMYQVHYVGRSVDLTPVLLDFKRACALVNYLNGGTGVPQDVLEFIADRAMKEIKEADHG